MSEVKRTGASMGEVEEEWGGGGGGGGGEEEDLGGLVAGSPSPLNESTIGLPKAVYPALFENTADPPPSD